MYLFKNSIFRVVNHVLYSLSRTVIDFFKPGVIHGLEEQFFTLVDFNRACWLFIRLKMWRNLAKHLLTSLVGKTGDQSTWLNVVLNSPLSNLLSLYRIEWLSYLFNQRFVVKIFEHCCPVFVVSGVWFVWHISPF